MAVIRALALAVLFALPNAVRAQDVAEQLRTLVQAAALGPLVGISVVDANTGNVLFEHNSNTPLNPASNTKLLTAAAALLELGPARTLTTRVYGHVEPNGTVGVLYVVGSGDPTLRFRDLIGLANALHGNGVRRVDEIRIDASIFDDVELPPAFDQQPTEMAAFRSSVSAFAVDRNAFFLTLHAGLNGAPVALHTRPDGYFEVDNRLVSTLEWDPPVRVRRRRLDDHRLGLTITGGIPEVRSITVRERADFPLFFSGRMLGEALSNIGIAGAHRVTLGALPRDRLSAHLVELVSHESAPVALMLHPVGKWSSNLVAETLLKLLGAGEGGPATFARGIDVLRTTLRNAGVDPAETRLVNGSGLFNANRLSASHLTTLLSHMYRDPGVSTEYLAHLAVGDRDGTLLERFRDLPFPGIVRAKTGTLNDVIALSGYVLGPAPGRTVAFSILLNGIRGRQDRARQLADDLVLAIARHLWSSERRD